MNVGGRDREMFGRGEGETIQNRDQHERIESCQGCPLKKVTINGRFGVSW
jgi:hypothetical protein